MRNVQAIAVLAMLALSGCNTQLQVPPWAGGGAAAPESGVIAPDTGAAPVAYTITQAEGQQIPGRVLAQVNSLRAGSGLAPLMLSPQLSSAAAVHSRDMAGQNRAWHWGSDGSSPSERAQRQGFYGHVLGENISESYENDMQTLNAWMQVRDTRDIIMDPTATQLGFAWYQEDTRKIWWTLLTGR
ncbi:MAG: CAP domain-containing protein [Paracoccus sp. (in: a-proteobacteria)]|uniref:CAP domain-containing protein n=1 Tax=Paracoccus sp. TaxID=267 RepID=UPI0026E01969|nr:CAP domain-containing protein [Paracoccus sp. (in: a-proteobacteria)]MDO5630804.1 CAP domain-containing protein [Paracoccus sp. (in: a-proteobacteria)]